MAWSCVPSTPPNPDQDLLAADTRLESGDERFRLLVEQLSDYAVFVLDANVQHKPDVIVSDIGTPGEDGYSFIRKLRSLPREEGGRIPALALTAYARADDRRKALAAGYHNHAAKPIEPQELLLVIANLAGRFA